MAFCFFFDTKMTAVSATTIITSTTEIIKYVPVSGSFWAFWVAKGEVEVVGVAVEVGEGVGVGVDVAVLVGAGVEVGAGVGVGVGAGETCTVTALD